MLVLLPPHNSAILNTAIPMTLFFSLTFLFLFSLCSSFTPSTFICSNSHVKTLHYINRVGLRRPMLPEVQEAWSSYNSALLSDPLITKSVTAGVILGAADLAGQTLTTNDKEASPVDEVASIDIPRALRFAFFGFVLQAPWNHFYYLFLDGALPPTVDPFTPTTAIKVGHEERRTGGASKAKAQQCAIFIH